MRPGADDLFYGPLDEDPEQEAAEVDDKISEEPHQEESTTSNDRRKYMRLQEALEQNTELYNRNKSEISSKQSYLLQVALAPFFLVWTGISALVFFAASIWDSDLIVPGFIYLVLFALLQRAQGKIEKELRRLKAELAENDHRLLEERNRLRREIGDMNPLSHGHGGLF